LEEPLHLAAYALLAVVPGLLWLYVFYRLDRYEPEPASLLARTFLLGGLALGPAMGLEALGSELILDPGGGDILQNLALSSRLLVIFLVVAPIEELLKFGAAWLSVGQDPEYDEPMDGVIYLVAAALGFSTAENLYYLSILPPAALATRGVFSCFLHASTSGLVGYWWSQQRFHGRPRWGIAVALLGASLAHGVFDAVAYSDYRYTFFVLAGLLAVLDLVLTYRIGQALEDSPFRPEGEGEEAAQEPG
jgi:RsiW-degrading membrane proteinase PrsW (M82 family)